MKLTRNLKKHLLPVCLVLAFALLLGLTLNLYKPLKQLTQKKVPNPENLLNVNDTKWAENITRNGITFHMNDDGSWHIFGTSTAGLTVTLTLDPVYLESGKQYSLSSGMKNDSLRSYFLALYNSSSTYFVGDLSPTPGESEPDPKVTKVFGAFTCASSSTGYHVLFSIPYAGAVIDETVYPCLVEGTEPGDFYTYK